MGRGDWPSPTGLPDVQTGPGDSPPFREGASQRHLGTTWLKASDYWGGVYTTSSGTQVRIYASPWFFHDDAWLQSWAGFFDDLFHSSELSRLTLVFLPAPTSFWYVWDISDQCGAGAAGCYDPASQILFAPGSDLPDGTQMETVIAHEYGHHIEANRSNAPWDANTTGPKFWSSQMNICARSKAGQVFPGDEGIHYTLNPGEGFAEAYRLTVYNAYTWTHWRLAPWDVVDPMFIPDSLAQAAAKSDALGGWNTTASTVTRFSGKLTKRLHTVMLRYRTPLDGDVIVRLFRPYNPKLTLIESSGAVVGSGSGSFSYTVCGTRSYTLRLSGRAGSRYQVEVTTP
jgi:hypothetical protein